MKGLTPFFLIFLIAFTACKEEKDEIPPSITTISPSDNTIYQVLDVVRVKASIRDNEQIEKVAISLEELGSGQRVGPRQEYFPSSNQYQLDDLYFISDSLLNSGSYYFRIEAEDGENVNTAYITIRINGIPKKALGVLAITDHTNNTEIIQIDDNNNSRRLFTQNSAAELAFDHRRQKLWYIDNVDEQVGGYDYTNGQTIPPKYPNGNGQADPILDLQFLNSTVYVSTQNGKMQGFDYLFQDVFTYSSPNNFRVSEIFPLNQRLMLRETDLLGQNQRLLYIFSNGAIDSQSSSTDEVIGFGYRKSDPDAAFQFINTQNGMEVRDYNLSNGQSSFFLEKINFNFHSLLQISDYEYLFYNDQSVVSYNLSTNFTRSLASGLNNPKVCFDEVNELVYVSSGSRFYSYDYNSGSLTGSNDLSFPIIYIAMRYNK